MPVFDPDNPKDFHVKTNPKTEEQIREEMLLPAGEYDFEVIKAEDKVSRNGNEMIKVELAVFRPNGSRQYVYDYLMEKMAFKLRHFCYAVGIGAQYEAGAVTATDCEGRMGRAALIVDTQPGYPPKNAVRDYIVQEGPTRVAAPNAAPKPAPVDTDEPPF